MHEKGHKTYLFWCIAASLLLGAGPGGRQMPGMGRTGSDVAVQAQFNYFGPTASPVFPDHANTVSHLVWNGSAMVDLKAGGPNWSMVGTVPQVAAGPFFPATIPGAGPTAGANYYTASTAGFLQLGTSIDLTVEALIEGRWPLSFDNFFLLKRGQAWESKGFSIRFAAINAVGLCEVSDAAVSAQASFPDSNSIGLRAITCTVTWGAGPKATVSAYEKNAVVAVTQASSSVTTSSGDPARLMEAFDGRVYEIHVIQGTALDAATIYARQNAALATGPIRGGTLTHTRTTSAIIESPSGTLATFAPNVPRVNSSGLLLEPTRTNLLLRSEDLATTWADATGGGSVTVNQAAFMGRGTVADRVVTVEIGDDAVSAVTQTVASQATGWYVFSYYAKSTSGTPTVYAVIDDADGSIRTCSACVLNSSTYTRCYVGASYTTGETLTAEVGFDTRTGTGCPDTAIVTTFDAAGFQLELSPDHSATSYIPTGATAVQRTQDLASIAQPKLPLASDFCAHMEFTPSPGTDYSVSNANVFLVAGVYASDNFFMMREADGKLQASIQYPAGAYEWMKHSLSDATPDFVSIDGCRQATISLEINLPAGGTADARAVSGAQGWSTRPTGIYLMQRYDGYQHATGSISRVKICKGGTAARCQ